MSLESRAKREQVPLGHHAMVIQLIERVYSKGELSRVDDLVAPQFRGDSTVATEPFTGVAGFKAHLVRLRGAFHRLTFTIEDVRVEPTSFEVSWTVRGTQERRFLGVTPGFHVGGPGEEPHGTRIEVPGVTRGSIRNGRIEEIEMVWDLDVLSRQIDLGGAEDPLGNGPRSISLGTSSVSSEPVSDATALTRTS